MSETQPLADLLLLHRRGGLSRERLESSIFTHLRNNPHRFRLNGWNEDDRSDFLGWLYPRLHRAVDAYRDTGSGFDAYVHSLVRWSSLEYRSTEAERAAMEIACWQDRAADVAAESEENYRGDDAPPPSFKNPKPILILALKNCYFVSDELADKIARAIRMDVDELSAALAALRAATARRWTNLKELETRVASQYYRCVAYAARQAACPDGTARRENLTGLLDRARKRYRSMRQRLERTTRDVSNRQVAEYLRVPKGTVDSCVAVFKQNQGIARRRP